MKTPSHMTHFSRADREAADRCAAKVAGIACDKRDAARRGYLGGIRAGRRDRPRPDADRIRAAFVRWHLAHGIVPTAQDIARETGIVLKDVQAQLAMMRKRSRR